jgi:hypothetical protein
MLAAACTSSGDDDSSAGSTASDAAVGPDSTGSPSEAPATTEAPGPAWVEGESDYLFDQNKLRTYNIVISDENLATLDAEPAAEEWVDGGLEFEGDDIGEVGVRYKGSIGAWIGCLEGTQNTNLDNPIGLGNPTGAKTCHQLSMKVKINYNESREFYGVRTLQFHAMNNDPSRMRERLGYWLYSQAGVAAPRAVHARVNINGVFHGVFLLVEQLDGRFTRYHFDDGKGNLFKQVWPLTATGEAQGEAALVAGLRTNEDEAEVGAMVEFANEIAAASPADAPAVIEKWMDIDSTIANQAVERLIRHDDSSGNWRCFGDSACFSNNFYWYMEPNERRAHLVPWDIDVSLAGIRHPLITVFDAWGEITDDCAAFDVGAGFLKQRSAACDPIVAAWVQFDELYLETVNELADGPFSDATVRENITTWANQIEASMDEATDLYGDDVLDATTWNNAMDQLADIAAESRAEVLAAAEVLAGE